MIETIRKLFSSEDWMPARRVMQKDASWWQKLQHGTKLRFGYMPQTLLSGHELEIQGHQLYRFNSNEFLVHQLYKAGKPCCNLIVATSADNRSYLALSRKLQQKEIHHLFSDDEQQLLPDLTSVNRLYVREHTPGVREWLTMQYTRRISHVSGEKIENGKYKEFTYQLFVNEEYDKALEIEWFGNDEYDIFATVYCPLSDIVQVIPGTVEASYPSFLDYAKESEVEQPYEQVAEKVISIDSVKKERNSAIADIVKPEPLEFDEFSGAPAEENSESIHAAASSNQNQRGDHIACNIRVAGKIIEEALRNDMALSGVVRKVLGLPVAINDTVEFQLPLSHQDCRILSERYGIPADNEEALRAQIIEDLIDFTGEREAVKHAEKT
jgi:hypothetical protein